VWLFATAPTYNPFLAHHIERAEHDEKPYHRGDGSHEDGPEWESQTPMDEALGNQDEP